MQHSIAKGSPNAPEKNSGRIYFKIFNGRKLCYDTGSAVGIKKTGEISSMDTALWELVRDSKSYYNIKNRSTGQYMVCNNSKVQTTQSVGENGKWCLDAATKLSIDECKVPYKDTTQVWANQEGNLVMEESKTSFEETEQADQLFKFVYADSEDWS